MARQTETTKQAAVWQPPRLRRIYLKADFASGSLHQPYLWEGGTNNPGNPAGNPYANYRMPTSGDVSHGFFY